ncbi:MAG: ArsR family transcriptional regulator [Polyangiaceae bacterium]|nr:ArsR family transcriptional regulator [Polyangiaceae bacterium]MCW5791122.1 ArsR family transcriptional regulator [Polyangiaceae bacterium]
MTGRAEPEARHSLWPSEVLVSELVGRLMEFWGFKRNMGRVWAVLYLAPHPLSAQDLKDTLQLSAGAVSMTLSELLRWGVVRRVWVPGERRDYYAAEVQIWKMVSRVFAEREGGEIRHAIEVLEQALSALESQLGAEEEEARARAELQRSRVVALLGVARLGEQLLRSLVSTAQVNAEPLSRLELASEGEEASAER